MIPCAENTQIGPLALRSQLDKVSHYVESAKTEGATLVSGGNRPERDGLKQGWFFEPTIFVDVKNTMTFAQEEIFGPVVGIIKFKDETDLIHQANQTALDYGLAAGVWTRDIDKSLAFCQCYRRRHSMDKYFSIGLNDVSCGWLQTKRVR